MQIHERIKKARESAGLTPDALAKKIGVPRTTYLYWEEVDPKIDKVRKVAKALNLSEEYFFGKIAEKTDEKFNKQENAASENISSGTIQDRYIRLLEQNDQFFKTQYHNLLVSLNTIIAQGQKAELLLKLNLQHVGAVEALQRGLDPDVVQEQINIQIASSLPSENMDNDGDN